MKTAKQRKRLADTNVVNISWSSKRQGTVTLSSTKAAHAAEIQGTNEAPWLQILLSEPLNINEEEVGHVLTHSADQVGITPKAWNTMQEPSISTASITLFERNPGRVGCVVLDTVEGYGK
jgi:hypothetical protein